MSDVGGSQIRQASRGEGNYSVGLKRQPERQGISIWEHVDRRSRRFEKSGNQQPLP